MNKRLWFLLAVAWLFNVLLVLLGIALPWWLLGDDTWFEDPAPARATSSSWLRDLARAPLSAAASSGSVPLAFQEMSERSLRDQTASTW